MAGSPCAPRGRHTSRDPEASEQRPRTWSDQSASARRANAAVDTAAGGRAPSSMGLVGRRVVASISNWGRRRGVATSYGIGIGDSVVQHAPSGPPLLARSYRRASASERSYGSVGEWRRSGVWMKLPSLRVRDPVAPALCVQHPYANAINKISHVMCPGRPCHLHAWRCSRRTPEVQSRLLISTRDPGVAITPARWAMASGIARESR
jgi:hypothetical protein